MLTRVPLALSLDLDPGAVDQKVQRALRAPMRDVHGQRLLAAAQSAEVGHIPVQANQPQQALNEPGRLPQRQPEQDFHRQAGLDSSFTVDGCRPRLPVGFDAHTMSGSNQIVSDPQRLIAVLYASQFRVV